MKKKRINDEISMNQSHIAGVIAIVLIATLMPTIAFKIGDYKLAILVGGIALFVIFLLRATLLPVLCIERRTHRAIITLLTSIFFALIVPEAYFWPLLCWLCQHFDINLPKTFPYWQRIILLIIFSIVILLLNLTWSKRRSLTTNKT